MKKLKIDQPRKELVSLEVLKFIDTVDVDPESSQEDLERMYNDVVSTEYIVVDDLSQQYILKVGVSTDDKIRSLEPDFLPDGDNIEMAETIQEVLRDNGINVYGSDFNQEVIKQAPMIKKEKLSRAIMSEMNKGMEELNKVGKLELKIEEPEDT